MDFALLVARLLLAAVFAVAGLAKLADLAGSRRAARDFGVPAGLADLVGVALPVVELVVAILLIPRATARWGAAAALVLLVAFVGAMANQLRRGQHPDCHCFGQLHSEPVGPTTIVRNGFLALVAVFVLVPGWNDPGMSATGWLGAASPLEAFTLVVALASLVVLAAVVWLLVHLMSQNVRLIDRIEGIEGAAAGGGRAAKPVPAAPAVGPGLAVGSPAPAFALQGLFGETLTLAALQASGRPALLVFTDPGCGPCNSLMPDIGRWQRERSDSFTVAVLSQGSVEANRPKAAEHGLSNVLLQRGREVAEAYEANATPAAVLVRTDGTIGSPVALGPDAIRELAATISPSRTDTRPRPAVSPTPAIPLAVVAPAAGNGAGANGATGNGALHHASEEPVPAKAVAEAGPIGQPAPAVDMRDLRGRPIRLSSFRGKPTLLLFWNLNSRLCEDMLPDIRALDAAPPPGAPRLVVVSSGPPAGARAMRLQARIVNDPDVRVTHAFGVDGTPAAVLLDAEGRIASPVTFGARFILALAGGFSADDAPADGSERIGRPAPNPELKGVDGEAIRLADFRGQPTLVVQWDTNCGYCARMLRELKAHDVSQPAGTPQLLVVARGDRAMVRSMDMRSAVAFDEDFRGMRAFRAYATPSAVLVDADGKIASPIAVGAAQVMGLARAATPDAIDDAIRAIEDPDEAGDVAAPTIPIGAPAPSFSLPDLEGIPVSLDSYRGESAVLVFWNPECGFCQRMLPNLLELEEEVDDDAPTLLVVSTGDVERNRAQGIRATIVLDKDFAVGSAFGATGTPSAVLIDGDGRVASDVVVGARGVLALAAGEDAATATSQDDPITGLRVGSRAPELVLPDVDGNPVSLASFRGERTMLLFWDLGCGFCNQFLPELREWESSKPPGAPRVVVVSSGDVEKNRALGIQSTLLLDDDDSANRAFNNWSTPSAIMIDADGLVASSPMEGAPAVLALANGEDPVEATARWRAAQDPEPLPIGDAAPVVTLPDLDGSQVELGAARGNPTINVFWSTECGYCQRMLPDLIAWERERPTGAPDLVLVSRGSAPANREMGFDSPVLLDDGSNAMHAYRVIGTPSAVVVDAEGRIASGVAVGAEEIFKLLEAPAPIAVETVRSGPQG